MQDTLSNYNKENSLFKHIGYSLDYYVYTGGSGKFVGYTVIEEPDREVFGYAGRKREVLKDDVVLANKKVIKKGTEVVTELSPMVGRSTVKIFGAKSQSK
jgi:hypothetical protein